MTDSTLSRRQFLMLSGAFVAATAVTPLGISSSLALSRPRFSSRKLAFFNIHTLETFEGEYWREGHYNEKALRRLAHLLRDRRNQKEHPMDPKLFDVLHQLQASLGTQDPFHVICGYRSKETNAMLHHTHKGVAKNSLHCKGKAIDICLESVPLKELKNAAVSLKAGGVGYYPRSGFIHMDIRPKPTVWG